MCKLKQFSDVFDINVYVYIKHCLYEPLFKIWLSYVLNNERESSLNLGKGYPRTWLRLCDLTLILMFYHRN